jgi:trimethylamine--corrinoid protein Co-methyltransferase
LAEQIALRILDWALFGMNRLAIGASISVMDMRTMIRPYGRPEMAIANLMTAQIARRYRARFSGHAGLSDSKLPSVESGAQKALTAIPTLMAGGHVWMDAGLLGIDEVVSPVQLVLDNEFLSALKHFTREFQVDEESITVETILEAGPGGQYLDKDHTARYFRNEHWNPGIWSRQMLQAWTEAGCKLDVDTARETAISLMEKQSDQPALPEDLERTLLSIIQRAKTDLKV